MIFNLTHQGSDHTDIQSYTYKKGLYQFKTQLVAVNKYEKTAFFFLNFKGKTR